MSEPCRRCERYPSTYPVADAIDSLVAAVLATAKAMAERDEARAERDEAVACLARLLVLTDRVRSAGGETVSIVALRIAIEEDPTP